MLETERLVLRQLAHSDAGFIVGLLNQPSFLRFIGDRGVRSLEDARRYLDQGPLASYRQHGYGLFLTSRREDGVPIGICGLLKREALPHPDVGFAFLPEHWSKGYAVEAASAVIEWGRRVHRLGRIVAITAPGNEASKRVLARLGMRFDSITRLTPEAEPLELFASD